MAIDATTRLEPWPLAVQTPVKVEVQRRSQVMMDDEKLQDWRGCAFPTATVLEGKYCLLEKLSVERHEEELFNVVMAEGEADRHRYLLEEAPASREEFHRWTQAREQSVDPYFFTVIDKRNGLVSGRMSLMRITPEHGVLEIGHIFWGKSIAKSTVATESIYLLLSYAFDTLGYRRVEWKCDNLNEPSKRAARRFGFVFEGLFRKHLVVKGRNRDTAWFAMVDDDWPNMSRGYQAWLDDSNFDEYGYQLQPLSSFLVNLSSSNS